MTGIYTIVETLHGSDGHASNGRKTREEAISEARNYYEYVLKEAKVFLATPNDQLKVRVVRGIWKQDLIEELKP